NLLIPSGNGSFDVIVGMDWLSQNKAVIVCHEKVVEIPLTGGEVLRVQGERTLGVAKDLMNAKDYPQVEFRVDLISGATPVVKSPYRLAPSEIQELPEQLQELQDKGVKDKILATSSETPKVENAPAEMLRDMDQQIEKRADDGKSSVVNDALSRKEQVKPRRVRAMAMTIQYRVRGMILVAQSEAFKQKNVLTKRLHGLD
ncbi:hypothetical protein Tco_1534582, partial [Tanacetum coccineum]